MLDSQVTATFVESLLTEACLVIAEWALERVLPWVRILACHKGSVVCTQLLVMWGSLVSSVILKVYDVFLTPSRGHLHGHPNVT